MKRAAHGLQRKSWTESDDNKLMRIYNELKASNNINWAEIAQRMGVGFSVRQCRDRYSHYLDPSIKWTPYTLEEDDMILKKVKELGQRWSCVAESVKGRTPTQIRNRWNLLQRQINNPQPQRVIMRLLPFKKPLEGDITNHPEDEDESQEEQPKKQRPKYGDVIKMMQEHVKQLLERPPKIPKVKTRDMELENTEKSLDQRIHLEDVEEATQPKFTIPMLDPFYAACDSHSDYMSFNPAELNSEYWDL